METANLRRGGGVQRGLYLLRTGANAEGLRASMGRGRT